MDVARGTMRAGVRLVALALSQFMVAIDFDIVFVALPAIGRALGFSAEGLQWVVSAYTVVLGGFLLLGGRAVDRWGPRRMFVVGVTIFGLASLLGGAAGFPALLVTARAVQGLGAALVIPAGLALITASFAEGPERNRAFAVWGVAGASGAAVGALGGGVLTAALGWQWVLWVNVPVAALLLVSAAAFTADGPRIVGPFDLAGALLATAASSSLVLGIVTRTWWVGAAAVLFGVALAVVEGRVRDPLLPAALLRRSLLLPAGAVFLFMGAIAAVYYATTTFLQDVLGFGALAARLAFLPLSVLSMLGSGVGFPRLAARVGVERTLAAGLVGMALALVGLAWSFLGTSYGATVPWLVWAGFAGVAFPAVFRAAASAAPADRQGVAGAFVSTAQYLGGSVGLAAILAGSGLDRPLAGVELPRALALTGLLAALAAGVAAAVVIGLRPRR